MLAKDEGYDEFLAKQIQQGLEDAKAGRGLPLEEAMALLRQSLAEKIKAAEQDELNQQNGQYDMLFGEKGYDDFLAEKNRIGREDSRAGRVVSLEEAKAQTWLALEEKIKEIEQAEFAERAVIYG